MRKISIYVMMTIFLFGCGGGKQVPKFPRTRTLVLSGQDRSHISKSYVVNGERYYPLPESHGFVQVGKASWYGEKFHGRPTAGGEIFDMHKKTAAHKTLPLGTYVKVINLSNKKSTHLRINDRGPFVKGRIIDLSYAAAQELALVGPGLADVKVIAYGKEVGKLKTGDRTKPIVEAIDLAVGEFTIQIGAFQNRENAVRLVNRVKPLFDYTSISPYRDENRRTLHRVQVSKSKTLDQAEKIEKRLEKMGFKGAFIVGI